MKNLKSMLPFWIIILLGFYALPFAIQNTGSAMLVLLIAVPLICFVCGLLFGIKNGFSLIFSLVIAILFIPAIFIFYNATAWIYIVAYFFIPFVGNLIGMVFTNKGNYK